MKRITSLAVYCGSSPGLLPEYLEAATQLGRFLASENVRVIYGGGDVGLMGAVADGAIEAGGKVIGVIPKTLADKEVAHSGLTELYIVTSMHERKMKMAELSDAFIALPGGIGTLEEIFEVFTWTQLGFHTKPCAFLNVAGFFDSLIAFLDQVVEQRFLKPEHLDSLFVDDDQVSLLEKLNRYEPEKVEKWIGQKSEL